MYLALTINQQAMCSTHHPHNYIHTLHLAITPPLYKLGPNTPHPTSLFKYHPGCSNHTFTGICKTTRSLPSSAGRSTAFLLSGPCIISHHVDMSPLLLSTLCMTLCLTPLSLLYNFRYMLHNPIARVEFYSFNELSQLGSLRWVIHVCLFVMTCCLMCLFISIIYAVVSIRGVSCV